MERQLKTVRFFIKNFQCLSSSQYDKLRTKHHFCGSKMILSARFTNHRENASSEQNTALLKIYKSVKKFKPKFLITNCYVQTIFRLSLQLGGYLKLKRKTKTTDRHFSPMFQSLPFAVFFSISRCQNIWLSAKKNLAVKIAHNVDISVG